MSVPKKNMGLGKGLDALITASARVTGVSGAEQTGVTEIDINKLEPNREQPRRAFDEDSLRELADSLTEFGMIQPIIVKADEGGAYTIIAGERRWRAARMAKLNTVPVIVREYSQPEMLQVALVENIQRKDLNPIEEALSYKRLIDEFFFTQADLAAKIGKGRNVISNGLALLNLDPRVQNLLAEGRITAGHGRALAPAESGDAQFELAEKAVEDGLSVRELEKHVAAYADKEDKPEKPPQKKYNAYVGVEKDLKTLFGTQVYIKDGKAKGKIEIEFYSPEELDRLLGMFKGLA